MWGVEETPADCLPAASAFPAVSAPPRCAANKPQRLSYYALLPAPMQDARRAFKALAYKRYQHVPLYLEWAPKGVFSSPPPPPRAAPAAAPAGKAAEGGAAGAAAAASKGTAAPGSRAEAKASGAQAELLTGLAEAQAEEAESSSIYVKNLAWATAEAALKAHFDAAVSAAGALGCWRGMVGL